MAGEMIGRIPPHNADAEIALLGAILFRNKALDEVQQDVGLLKDDFYTRSHQLIWEGINALRDSRPGEKIDYITLCDYLKQKGLLEDAGGYAYVSNLTNAIPVSTNALYYANIIKRCSLKRELLELSVLIGEKAFDETEDVKDSVDILDNRLSLLATNITTGKYKLSGDYMYNVVDDIKAKMSGEKKSGVLSGFYTLDAYLGGFKPSELIIIGARPSVGKTAFSLSLVHNMAFKNADPIKVGFFSLEMSGAALMERLIARESSINSMALRNGQLTPEMDTALMTSVSRMYEKQENLLIQDTPNIKLMEIKAQARRMVRTDGVKIIFIDYIGLIEAEGMSAHQRHEQIGYISRSLKSLARELNVPIIVLSQVNREAGKDRAPMLADLRESGSIEQDADVVLLLDDASKRLNENNKVEQYANEDIPDPHDNNASSNSRKIKVIIAKQRNGSTGAFDMMFVANFVSFVEIYREH